MYLRRWLLSFLLFTCVAQMAVAQMAQATVTGRVLRCESIDHDRSYCLAYIRGSVKLLRQLSLEDCRYQQSWGYDEGGVWVEQGCRGEFFIRETQRLEELLEEPDSNMMELMNMTIVAETVSNNALPDWSYSLSEHIKIGVNYNDWGKIPLPEDWQSFWFLPALLKISF